MGGWVFRKIKNKNHLSPAEAEIGAELGNNEQSKESMSWIYKKSLPIAHGGRIY